MPARPLVVTTIERPPATALAALAQAGAATTHECYARTGYLHGIKAITGGVTIAGAAVTSLSYAGENLMLIASMEYAQPGDVLVAAVTSPSEHGMFGDVLATACTSLGIGGVVLDAGARDVRSVRDMGFPVWSRSVAVSGTVKNTPGWVNIPVVCGGQIVNPGDAIVADDDGVVVVARADVEAVAKAALEKVSMEQRLRDSFGSSGVHLMDKGGRRELLARYLEPRERNA
ncbi:MAG TPA: 4-carboxy-4-hydroxy-2-oxoadipate aldolase/oxaloacetate decarboxylase [Mycobacteriales bacterium]